MGKIKSWEADLQWQFTSLYQNPWHSGYKIFKMCPGAKLLNITPKSSSSLKRQWTHYGFLLFSSLSLYPLLPLTIFFLGAMLGIRGATKRIGHSSRLEWEVIKMPSCVFRQYILQWVQSEIRCKDGLHSSKTPSFPLSLLFHLLPLEVTLVCSRSWKKKTRKKIIVLLHWIKEKAATA